MPTIVSPVGRHDNAPQGFPQSLAAGARLGHYLVLAQIGAGGMGVVYRAHDDRADRSQESGRHSTGGGSAAPAGSADAGSEGAASDGGG